MWFFLRPLFDYQNCWLEGDCPPQSCLLNEDKTLNLFAIELPGLKK